LSSFKTAIYSMAVFYLCDPGFLLYALVSVF
jgi:hypothetical protein